MKLTYNFVFINIMFTIAKKISKSYREPRVNFYTILIQWFVNRTKSGSNVGATDHQ